MATFKRKEIKYLLGREDYDKIASQVLTRLQPDRYGRQEINNIYFDTENYDVIRESLERPIYKEKLRLRSYGAAADGASPVYLELKKKYDGLVHKRRVCRTYAEMLELLAGEKPVPDDISFREIFNYYRRRSVSPKIFITYFRTAYYLPSDPQFRLTIDEDLRFRTDELAFKQEREGEPLFNDERFIMEIKADGGMPLWLSRALDESRVYPASFSKYGEIYKRKICAKR